MQKLSIQDRNLTYIDEGSGFPVIFGHSYLWDTGMWTPQIARLKDRYRCLVPELWGHGQCDGVPATPYDLDHLTKDYLRFADALGLDQFAVVGLSVGGMWAAQLAMVCPERVKALVLMDTFLGPEPEETRQRYFGMLDIVERSGGIPAPLIDQILPLFFATATLAGKPGLVDRFRQQLSNLRSDQIESVVTLGRAIFGRTSMLDRLAEITAPTLVIVGEEDRSRPPHEAQEMVDLLKVANLAIIPAAGHVSNLEQPDRINDLLEAFLAESVAKG